MCESVCVSMRERERERERERDFIRKTRDANTHTYSKAQLCFRVVLLVQALLGAGLRVAGGMVQGEFSLTATGYEKTEE